MKFSVRLRASVQARLCPVQHFDMFRQWSTRLWKKEVLQNPSSTGSRAAKESASSCHLLQTGLMILIVTRLLQSSHLADGVQMDSVKSLSQQRAPYSGNALITPSNATSAAALAGKARKKHGKKPLQYPRQPASR